MIHSAARAARTRPLHPHGVCGSHLAPCARPWLPPPATIDWTSSAVMQAHAAVGIPDRTPRSGAENRRSFPACETTT